MTYVDGLMECSIKHNMDNCLLYLTGVVFFSHFIAFFGIPVH